MKQTHLRGDQTGMPADIKPYLPLIAAISAGIAAIITGIFNQLLGPVFQSNREHSRATGLVLVDILAIRAQYGLLLHLPDVTLKLWEFGEEARSFLVGWADNVFSRIETAPEFEAHLRAIAPGDPFLAHELQFAKLLDSPIFTQMKSRMVGELHDQDAWNTIKRYSLEKSIPIIEQKIREVAWSHGGLFTWLKANWYLRCNRLGHVSKEYEREIAPLKAKLMELAETHKQTSQIERVSPEPSEAWDSKKATPGGLTVSSPAEPHVDVHEQMFHNGSEESAALEAGMNGRRRIMAQQKWEYVTTLMSGGTEEGKSFEQFGWDENMRDLRRSTVKFPKQFSGNTDQEIAMFNLVGQDGWDFVSTWEVPGKGLANEPVMDRYYLFKRPKQ